MVEYAYNIGGDGYALIINADLEPGKTYSVTIPAGAVTDLAGNYLAEGITFNFMTQAAPSVELSGLTLSDGSLSPAFDPEVTNYTVSVPADTVDSVTVTPTVADANATITVQGTEVTSGAASDPIGLGIGENIIEIVVTDALNNSMTYTITVMRVEGVAVSAGKFHSLAVKSDGTVWAWGGNQHGELGDGTGGFVGQDDYSDIPVKVPGLTNVVSVAAGAFHSLALKDDGTVWAWGENSDSQLGDGTDANRNLPVQVLTYYEGDPSENNIPLTDVVAVAAGNQFSLALKADNTVWSWGYDSYNGHLGIGTIYEERKTAVQVLKGQNDSADDYLNGIVAIAAGTNHSLALKDDGTVWGWSENASGPQLALGWSVDYVTSPVQIAGDVLTNVTDIAAGAYSNFASSGSQDLFWGSELGTYNSIMTPTRISAGASPSVSGYLENVKSLALGSYGHAVSMLDDGSIYSWGDGSDGQIGDGTYGVYGDLADSSTPVKTGDKLRPDLESVLLTGPNQVTLQFNKPIWTTGGLTDGTDFILSVSGTARSVGTIAIIDEDNATETIVLNYSGDPVAVGQTVIVEITNTGAAKIRDVSYTNNVMASGSISTSEPVAMPKYENLVAFSNKAVLYFNEDIFGATDLAATDFQIYVDGSNYRTVISDPADFSGHTLVLIFDGQPLVDGQTLSVTIVGGALNKFENCLDQPLDGDVIVREAVYRDDILADGNSHNLFVSDANEIMAWGSNNYGEVGTGEYTYFETVAEKVYGDMNNPLIDMITVAAGGSHSLTVKNDGTVWAWGDNRSGQLGDGNEGYYSSKSGVPVQVVDLLNVIAVAGGGAHSLALESDGTVWTWGSNGSGQLGLGYWSGGDSAAVSIPNQVGAISGVIAVAAGSSHSLALKDDGTIWAWGSNFYGQLGDGTNHGRNAPVQVEGLEGVVAIAANGGLSLAVRSDGTVWAWGDNQNGQIGDGTGYWRNSPVQVLKGDSISDDAYLAGIVYIAVGNQFAVAVNGDGTVWAWGGNNYGYLGDGTTTGKNTPIQVLRGEGFGYRPNLENVTDVVAGNYHTMAVQTNGTVLVWGRNDSGSYDGDAHSLPVIVNFP